MKFLTSLVLAGLMTQVALAQSKDKGADKEKEKEQAEEAETKIKEFNKAKSKFKTEDDWVSGMDALSSPQHPKILKELAELLKSQFDKVKMKAAEMIGKYHGDKSAADYLLAALSTEAARAKKSKQGDDIGHETACKILEALGECAVKSSADKLHGYLNHQNVEICKSTIKALGQIKSLSTPDQLIKMLQDMEQAAARAQAPAGNPPPGAPPGGLPPGAKVPPNVPPGVNPNAQLQQESARRRSFLEPVINDSLKSIIGVGPYKTAGEWSKAWNKERPGLIKKEQEAEKASK
jgi:DNA-binding transcriptional ArsR family regulator